MESVDLTRLLLDLLVVLLAGRLAAELAERLRVPAVLGEIVAGIVVGPSVLGLVELTGDRGVSLRLVAEIGVLLLLVQVGMEMDPAELGRVGRASMTVAVIGVAVPFAAGAVAGVALGQPRDTAVFLGAALTATSVGLTARVFGDLRALATTEARIVLGAAVADDVLGLVILTVVVKVVAEGTLTMGTVVGTVVVAVGFLLVGGAVGLVGVPPALDAVHRWSRSGATLTVAALVIVLVFAAAADAASLAFIVGAFVAGLSLGRSDHHGRIAADLNSVGAVFIPVFFVLIGIEADLDAMLRPNVLVTALVLFALAVAGKVVSATGVVGVRADRLLVGLGMIPRGEVGLIFASIGFGRGLLDEELYGALLLVVLLTSVITPPLLRWRLSTETSDTDALDADTTAEPAVGWVTVMDGEIQLHGRPPLRASVPIALTAAALARDAQPSGRLLDWFGERRQAPLQWSSTDTGRLLEVARTGSARAVRFLDVTGVLERAVPDLATSLERRRADPGQLDPAGVLRFPTVASVGERLDGDADHDLVLLAALVIDVVGPDVDPGATSSLLGQLAAPDPERVEHVLSATALLRAASADAAGYDPAEVRQLAAHIATPAVADAAHLLAAALEPTGWHRRGLDELHGLIIDLLHHPELLGAEADSLADARRAAAEQLCHEPGPVARLRTASVHHLLAHEPPELARQARLVEPRPAAGDVRVAVSPDPRPDHWVVDVACRDVEGLLARLTQALTEAGGDIVTANLATWDDGAVVDTFVIRSAVRPHARHLSEAMEARLRGRIGLQPLDDVQVVFDNLALPWHTAATVTGRDRAGVLHAVAASFAAAGIVVHSARIAGGDDGFRDRFAVSDRIGRKLDEAAMARLWRALDGYAPRRRLFRSAR